MRAHYPTEEAAQVLVKVSFHNDISCPRPHRVHYEIAYHINSLGSAISLGVHVLIAIVRTASLLHGPQSRHPRCHNQFQHF